MSEAIVMDDGLLTFIVRGDGEDVKCSIDLMMLALAASEVMQIHKLPEWVDPATGQAVEDTAMPTVEFLQALTAKLDPLWETSRPLKMTPTIARRLWLKSGQAVAHVKKNTPEPPNLPTTSESTPSEPDPSQENNQPGCC
jgi:hypothetical protein